MNGWIKLHRKIWDSQNFKHRKNLPNLITVWVWLLTHANENGVVTFGRNQISQDTSIHPSSVERVISYLRAEMSDEVKYEANKLFSTLTILNWAKYQSKPNNEPKYKRSTTEVQPNTNKNKEVRIKKDISKVEMQGIYDHYVKSFDKDSNRYKLSDNRKRLIKTRLKDTEYSMIIEAITNISQQTFYRGDNDRGWSASLEFILRNYEQVERFANATQSSKTLSVSEMQKDMEYVI